MIGRGVHIDNELATAKEGSAMIKLQGTEAAARAAHEANRAFCIALGDLTQPAWEDAPEWQKSSAIVGVKGVIDGNGPRESHECWLAEKRAAGWTYGETKDPANKRHPCFVDYDQLPNAQKAKDGIFVTVVRAVLDAIGKAEAVQ